MGKITIDQSHQVIATLAVNTDWESIDFKDSGLQDFIVRNPKEAGKQFTAFLKNGEKIVYELKTIEINRSMPFDPAFFGRGWSIDEEDERALALTKIDLNNVSLEAMLKPDEIRISGEEWLKRLKEAGHIRLDAKVFQTLWSQRLIPEKWKYSAGDDGVPRIFFEGTVLRNPRGRRCVPFLFWIDGAWGWGDDELGFNWYAGNSSSVVLVS